MRFVAIIAIYVVSSSVAITLDAQTPLPTSAKTVPMPPTITDVRIGGADYAFLDVPEVLPPGLIAFSFDNRGKVRHEMALATLKPGVTLAQLVNAAATQEQRAGLIDELIGLLIAGPGKTAGGRLLADLKPGRTYVLRCVLRDAAESQPHLLLGMAATFRVAEK
jgi:hypothetical protein